MRKPVFGVFEQVRPKLSCSDLTCEFYYKHSFTADQYRISVECLFVLPAWDKEISIFKDNVYFMSKSYSW